MGNLAQIEQAATKIIALCQKEKPTKTDKEKMLALHADIFNGIEKLAECERCGAISEMIVTMTLAEVTAKLCKECGVKALEAGQIQKTAPRRRTRRTRTSKPKAETAAQQPPSPAELHARVEAETGIKKADVKRVQKILNGIATPMSPEHTLTYVKREVDNANKREVDKAKLKMEEEALEKAVKMLMAG